MNKCANASSKLFNVLSSNMQEFNCFDGKQAALMYLLYMMKKALAMDYYPMKL